MRYFSIISSIFVAVLMVSNTIATKLFSLGPFIFTGAIFVFPISYIFGDILVEVYGYSHSRKIIWTGFFALISMSIIYWLVGLLPPAPGWENQEAYVAILGVVPRIVIASIIGFWVGEFSNAFVFAKLKVLTSGKHLWTRTIGSTIVGQGVDTTLFTFIGFFGIIPNRVLVAAILSGYIFKVVYEAVATPLTYKIVGFLKKREGIDHFDYKTSFNPFKF
ncbi:MAG: queuosine precursor transporter [Candidatus Woesearchaeota archaeon]|nr:queuosine precursor transporter [Candidatus Woesearchaeota archaeon]